MKTVTAVLRKYAKKRRRNKVVVHMSFYKFSTYIGNTSVHICNFSTFYIHLKEMEYNFKISPLFIVLVVSYSCLFLVLVLLFWYDFTLKAIRYKIDFTKSPKMIK